MQKLDAKSQGKKQNTYLKISHLTREKQALFDGPSKHTKKNQHLRQAHLQNVDFPREYLHIKPLGWISTQFVEQKRRKTKNYCHYSRFWKTFGVRHKHVERRI